MGIDARQGNRWQRVKDVFAAAIAVSADDRDRYLSEACGGDSALRREVEALLASHDEATSFFERPLPAGAVLAQVRAARDNGRPLDSGARLGSYEILERIGAGGMGEVYRARDVRLHRDVALKILPPALLADPGRRDRFINEARAASA